MRIDMEINSETERLKHPLVKLIPKNLWIDNDLFNQEISEQLLLLMQTPLQTILTNQVPVNTYDNKHTAWICIVAAHPEITPQQLEQLTRIFDLSTADSLLHAASFGLISYIQKTINTVNNDETKAWVKYKDFLMFVDAASNGHIGILRYLFGVFPDLKQEAIENNNYELYEVAARYGFQNIMEYLESQIPEETIETMIRGKNFNSYYYAAKNNHLKNMIHMEKRAPNLLKSMIQEEDYRVYKTACSYGRLSIVAHLEKVAGEHLIDMVSAGDWQSYAYAAERNQFNVVVHLEDKFPKYTANMIRANHFLAYKSAILDAPLEMLKHIESVADVQLEAMIKDDDYIAYRKAASCGRTLFIIHMEHLLPHLVSEMIQADNFGALRWALEAKKSATVGYLLSHSACLNYLETNATEYGDLILNHYITNQIALLKNEKEQIVTQHPNALFNSYNQNETLSLYYMVRNLIKRNDVALTDDIEFILSIPDVRRIAHAEVTPGQQNDLLRLAIAHNNQNAITILMRIRAVRALAEGQNFFEDELATGVNLRELAQDNESTMHELTSYEQTRLEAGIKHYSQQMKERGEEAIVNELRTVIAQRYLANPATITINNELVKLPLTWQKFIGLNLPQDQFQQAQKAYRLHHLHSAWRYLLKPNPWMSEQAEYIYVNPKPPMQRWSTFEDYYDLIALFWLGASDETMPPMDGMTVEDRINLFIDALNSINRTHNFDTKSGDNSIEVDDGEGDKPSCFPGVKRQLFHSCVSHKLLTLLTLDFVKYELVIFVYNHFNSRITAENRAKLKQALDYYCNNLVLDQNTEVLKELNIDEATKLQFLEYLTNKWGSQFTDQPNFTKHIEQELHLREIAGVPVDYAHALKLEGMVNLTNLLNSESLFQNNLRLLQQLVNELDSYKNSLIEKISSLGLDFNYLQRVLLIIAQIPVWQKTIAGLILLTPGVAVGIFYTVGIGVAIALAVFVIQSSIIICSQLYQNHYHTIIQALKQHIVAEQEKLTHLINGVNELFPNLGSQLELAVLEKNLDTDTHSNQELNLYKQELQDISTSLQKLNQQLSIDMPDEKILDLKINQQLQTLGGEINAVATKLNLLKAEYGRHNSSIKNFNPTADSVKALNSQGLFANNKEQQQHKEIPIPTPANMSI